MQGLRHYLLAVQFFTRVPITGALAQWVGFSPAMLRASAAHFPGVGVLVGGCAALAGWALLQRLPAGPLAPLVAAALSTVVTVLLTGGFHEDGLADLADGLGASADRVRVLEVMKDSRIGAFGAMALVLALCSKVTLLGVIGSVHASWMVLALVWAHTLSRTWPLYLIGSLAHVGDTAASKSKPLADQISTGSLLVGCLWCFCTLALVAYSYHAMNFDVSGPLGLRWIWPLGLSVAASALACAAMARLLFRRLGGFTGDALGATQQVCELACYLGWALAL